MPFKFSCTIDRSGFSALVDAARIYNRRTPALAANVAGFYVARQARVETHKRSVPIARMDAELAVEVTPRIGKCFDSPHFMKCLLPPRAPNSNVLFGTS